MVLGRVVAVAGLLLSTSAVADPGRLKRVWSDPPPMTDALPQESSTIKQTTAGTPPAQATTWPDEASRRPPSAAVEGGRPAQQRELVSAEQQDPVTYPSLPQERSTAMMDNPAVSPKGRRQLGPLAGFAAPNAIEAPQGQRATKRTVAPKFSRKVQRSIGRIRIVQFRKRRLVVFFTRF